MILNALSIADLDPCLKEGKGFIVYYWWLIGQKLEFVIDPTNITLYRLIMLELYDEEKLKTIKQICEIAKKEYALGWFQNQKRSL